MTEDERPRFAVVGVDHIHAFLQAEMLIAAGADFAGWSSADTTITPEFSRRFPDTPRFEDADALLEASDVDLIVTAAVPDRRAALACRAMLLGKDVLSDKPGAITFAEVARIESVARETARHWTVFFSERFASPSTEEALALVRAGAIGDVVHTLGIGPHRLGLTPRPDWFWDRRRAGGILTDLASHQIDQFLVFTSAEEAAVTQATRANRTTAKRPDFDDFAEILLRSRAATGYARVDWLTTDGLGTWGDGRLFVQGTEGAIEVRKNVDLAGRDGAEHVFVVDQRGTRYVDASDRETEFAPRLVRDVLERTESAVSTDHSLRVTRLAIEAEALATRLDGAF